MCVLLQCIDTFLKLAVIELVIGVVELVGVGEGGCV